MYSVTNRESFEHIRLWAAEVKEYGTPDVKTILVGNKIDLHDQREVLYDEGRVFVFLFFFLNQLFHFTFVFFLPFFFLLFLLKKINSSLSCDY